MRAMIQRPRLVHLVRLGLVLLLLLLVWAVFEHMGLRSQISVANLRQSFEQHWLLGLASFALLFALGNLVHIPGWVFLAAAALATRRLAARRQGHSRHGHRLDPGPARPEQHPDRRF